MKFLKRVLLDYVKKYINKPASELTLLDVGTGGGRYALFLAALFENVIGVDKNPLRIETAISVSKSRHMPNISYHVIDGEHLTDTPDIQSVDIVLFSNSFYFMSFYQVFDQLKKLKNKPLIVIREANEFTTTWAVPTLNKNSPDFDQAIYDKKIGMLRASEEYLTNQKDFILLEYIKDKVAGVTIFAMRERAADNVTGGVEFMSIVETTQPAVLDSNASPVGVQNQVIAEFARSIECSGAVVTNDVTTEITKVITENIPPDIPDAVLQELYDGFNLANCQREPPDIGERIRRPVQSSSQVDVDQIEKDRIEATFFEASAVVRDAVSDSPATVTLRSMSPRTTGDNRRGKILLTMIKNIGGEELQTALDHFDVENVFELMRLEEFSLTDIEMLERIIFDYIVGAIEGFRVEPEHTANVFLMYVQFLKTMQQPDLLITQDEINAINRS